MKTSKLTFTLFVFIGFIILGCDKNENQKEDKENPTENRPIFTLDQSDLIPDEDYEIYSIILEEFFAEYIVICQQTDTNLYLDSDYDIFVDNNPDFDNTTYTNYISINSSPYYFANNFINEDKQISLISPDEMNYIFDGREISEAMEEFQSFYPNAGGIAIFSRIGFNEAHTQAIFEKGSDPGTTYFLIKSGDSWLIEDVIARIY